MPGTNAGTGHPLTLRCAKCKTRTALRPDPERGTNLEATGRTKPATTKSVRQTNRLVQYRCRDCGHVGWTQHVDAERLVAAFDLTIPRPDPAAGS